MRYTNALSRMSGCHARFRTPDDFHFPAVLDCGYRRRIAGIGTHGTISRYRETESCSHQVNVEEAPENEHGQRHGQLHYFGAIRQIIKSRKREIAFVLLGKSGAPGGTRTPDLLVRSRTIKFHKLMNRRHMPVSNPLSIGLQIGLREGPCGTRRHNLHRKTRWPGYPSLESGLFLPFNQGPRWESEF